MTSKTADGTTRGQSPRGRVSYQHVFQAQINKKYPDKPAKYSVVLIFDKDTDFTAMKAAAEEALKKKWPNKRPLELKNPFRDGNIKDDKPEYADKIFVTFSRSEERRVGKECA